ncbi:recombinase-like helix-turn-helix domain-containing protein [Rhodococcus chondri]|uniref:Recombinase-like domain-containing protein n=1 Tax=Rhodococcus chondri TaxID=3065941 RepID=A0ABU7JWM4_9NOCA|nr:recombinase-like helix-turn-helix domain-containing protein [Rhodococcus sp. CC-R104]MEE2034270.1 hypothetical protein [Rhodococcus sp. CC-R104]
MSQYLVIHQTRTADPTPYETRLARAIEQVFGAGVHHLEGIVKELNVSGMHGPDGLPWTADSFTAEMRRIGG